MTGGSEAKVCIYCGEPIDENLPYCFGAHFSEQPTPYWHPECNPPGSTVQKIV